MEPSSERDGADAHGNRKDARAGKHCVRLFGKDADCGAPGGTGGADKGNSS